MPPGPSSLFTIIAERIFHASPNGVLVYQYALGNSMDAVRLVLVNARAERMFGQVPDPMHQLPADVLLQVYRTGETYHEEMTLPLSGQSQLAYYDVSAVKMDDFVSVFYVDVTANKQAQRAE